VDGAPLVSTHAAAQFIYATLKKHGTVRQLLLTAFQELAVTTDVLPGQIRNRIDQLQHVLQQYGYARATQAHMDRKMDGLVLLALLQQSFKSYADFATALLRLLEDSAVFEFLEAGNVVISTGDHPKQKLERRLLLQVCTSQGVIAPLAAGRLPSNDC
jgi:hypothetical protein